MRHEESGISKGMKTFVVTEVREKKKGFINPVIVTFQNGEVNEQHAPEFDVTLTSNENGETSVEVKTPNGQVFKDSHRSEKPPRKQVIAVRNRKTNQVKLVEVDSALLINSVLINSPTTVAATEDYNKEIKMLHRTFGGKKIVNRLEQRERLNLSSLPIADEVKKAVEDIKVDENVSLNDTEMESITNLLPPCNRDAKTLSNVYILNEIISEEELDALRNEVKKLEENKFDPKKYSSFFMHCYAEAQKFDGNLETRLAGILFAECLINFLKIPSKKLRSKAVCSFSSIINEKLLNEFSLKTDTSMSRPLSMRDKSLCYIIAVCLICCDYRMDLNLLSTATGAHLGRLSRLARVVGAVPAGKDETLFVLKLPLPALPKSSKRNPKRNPKRK